MSIPTFYPPIDPSPGSRHTQEIKLLEAEFGDGYSQVSPRGLNHIRRKYNVTWEALTKEQCDEIDQFFKDRMGYETFIYTPYGETEPVYWTCKQWDRSTSGGVHTFTAEFVQTFNLD